MAESPPLRYVARRLLANLAAGARLAFGAPVSLVSFRVSVPQFLALTLLLSVADTGEFLSDEVKTASWWVLLIWFTVMAARGMAVALGPSAWRRTQRALVAGCVFTGLTLVGLSLVPYQRLWLQPRDAVEP